MRAGWSVAQPLVRLFLIWRRQRGKAGLYFVLVCTCIFENVALLDPCDEWSVSEGIVLSSKGQSLRDEVSWEGAWLGCSGPLAGHWGKSQFLHPWECNSSKGIRPFLEEIKATINKQFQSVPGVSWEKKEIGCEISPVK